MIYVVIYILRAGSTLESGVTANSTCGKDSGKQPQHCFNIRSILLQAVEQC